MEVFMRKVDLKGDWFLSQDGGEPIPGVLPGCTYLDYMRNGMEDPFYGENETKATELAHHDYTYSRTFIIQSETIAYKQVDFVGDGLDTVMDIYLNDQLLGHAENINRTYRFDAKPLLQAGDNCIRLEIRDPYEVMKERQAAHPILEKGIPFPLVGHIRKTPCHFSWDWGPQLAPAGVMRSIGFEAYDNRIDDIRIEQIHKDGGVSLSFEVTPLEITEATFCEVTLTAPNGSASNYVLEKQDRSFKKTVLVENPELWWCNGLGDQPLYSVEAFLKTGETEQDRICKRIGLRTIELDTKPDDWGEQFRFVVNGVPIFSKGGDWIPADSFIQRTTREDYYWYIRECQKANMNMIRVWGGGYFEDENFYDACDEMGILVWQDCLFACNIYPFDQPEFVENIHLEIKDNVRRLRHRASLAIWCANNECEAAMGFVRRSAGELAETNIHFYHFELRDMVKEFDQVTPYWPGSPGSGRYKVKSGNRIGKVKGDTHLWSIWHGMFPIEDFAHYNTRFCSEFGMESMPVMKTIRSFHPEGEIKLLDPVMLLHQKNGSGNEKMDYYLLAKYKEPKKFEDFVYLSQIVQSDTVRYATECWKRNIGHQNGALYWQLNDCWPVASWAAVDYNKQKKAVLYHSGLFNKMLMVSNDYHKSDIDLYVINEFNHSFDLILEWTVFDFYGKKLAEGARNVSVGAVASVKAVNVNFKKDLKGIDIKDCFINVVLKNNECIVDEKSYLLVPDKEARLPKPKFTVNVTKENGKAVVRITSDCYARYVFVDSDALASAWDDNYITILPGATAVFTADADDSVSIDSVASTLTIQNMADIETYLTAREERKLRRSIFWSGKNWLTYILCKLFM